MTETPTNTWPSTATPVNPLDLSINDVKVIPDTMLAAIVAKRIITGFEIYGQRATHPTKKFIQLMVENAEHGTKATINMPFIEKESITNQSKVGKFLLRYSTLANGTVITIKRNGKGFWDVQLEDLDKDGKVIKSE